MRITMAVCVAVGMVTASGCKTRGCEESTCRDYCSGATDNGDLVFLDCVQNTDDLVLRDVDAEVIYECDVDYDALGREEGTCTTDYVDAKWNYCGCY